DLERYARVDTNRAVSIRRLANDEKLYQLPGMGPVHAWGFFSDDGRYFFLSSENYQMRLWRLTGPDAILVLEAQDQCASTFSPDSRYFALGHADRTIGIYELASGQKIASLETTRAINGLAFNPKYRQLAAACADGIQVLDLDTGKLLADLG